MTDIIMNEILQKGLDLFNCADGHFENYNIDLQTFNIFESISDLYYRENFHSDILALILNPFTNSIGNLELLKTFVTILQRTDKTFDFHVDENVYIEKEKSIKTDYMDGRIDILITNNEKKQAIIIENKINNAPDQENQLVKYMKFVEKELDIHNYKVIYLPLLPKNPPPKDTYDKSLYGEYIEKLDKFTIILPAIKSKDNNNIKADLVNDFLPECLKQYANIPNQNKSEEDTLAEVYLKQYKQLIEHLGVDSYMEQTKQEIINEIYSDKDKLNGCIELVNLFSSNKTSNDLRINLLGNAVLENMQQYLEDNEYIHRPEPELFSSYCKPLNNDVYLAIFSNSDFRDFGIGFVPIPKVPIPIDPISKEPIPPKFTQEQQIKLKKILNKVTDEDLLLTTHNYEKTKDYVVANEGWCYVELNITTIDKEHLTINDLTKQVEEWLDSCVSEFNNTLNITKEKKGNNS